MNDKKLEELHQYFTGYGSTHDELIIRLIKEYRLSIEEIYQHLEDKEELEKQNKRYRDLLKEIKSDIKTDYTDSEIENMPLLNVIIEQINKALEGED